MFRLSPSKSDLDKVKAAYDQGQNVNIWACDPHVIAGVMKSWFRELPDYVIPSRIGAKFAAACLYYFVIFVLISFLLFIHSFILVLFICLF